LVFSSNNTLISNSANSNNVGIYLFSSSGNNTLTSNSANLNKATGIVLALASSNNTLTNNSANSNNRYGIYLGFPSSNNTLTRNSANSNNYYGIVLDSSSNNKIYLNNFMNNNYNFYSFNSTNIWNSTAPISYTYKDKTYANYLGNYWTDYTNIDANNDGIWDNPRPIDLDKDYHPLVEPFENYEEKWSFAIITDSHIGWGYPDYGPEGWELAQEKNCLKNHPEEAQDYWLTERLNKSVDKIINLTDEYNIKFVVHLGDINDKGQYSELWKAKKILDRLNDAGIPYFPIIGNHEIWPYTQREGDAAGGEGGQIIGYGVRWVGKGGQADSPLGDEYFEDIFNESFFDAQFGMLSGINNAEAQDGKNDPQIQNYGFIYQELNFVFLDTVWRKGASVGIGLPGRVVAGAKGGGKLNDDTFDWLEERLNKYEEPAILFSHHPMVESILGTSAFNSEDLQKFDRIIEKSTRDVLSNFAGHIHHEKIWSKPRYPRPLYIHQLNIDNVVTTEAILESSNDTIRLVQVNGENINYDKKFGVSDAGISPYFTFYPGNPSPNATFQAYPKSTTYYYKWDFGDGSEPVEGLGRSRVWHDYAGGGIFNLDLEVQTPQGTAILRDVPITVSGELSQAYYLAGLKEGLKAISTGTRENFSETPQNILECVIITKVDLEEKPVAEIYIHFKNATEDIDLSNLTADVNLTARKSVIYMPSWPAVIEPSKILYIPSTGKGAVYISKNATNLNEVCLENADTIINVGETKDGMTVLTMLYNDTEYYIVFNVTGTGGGEFAATDLDTEAPANPYPSISGTHNGTIKPNQTITVNKLYTYPCPGTSGYTESIKLYENGIPIANGTWNGYESDWHNITIHNVTDASYVTLLENHEYHYAILTGSYPQIHHIAALPTANGRINCTEFTDANGKRYGDMIPAILLWTA